VSFSYSAERKAIDVDKLCDDGNSPVENYVEVGELLIITLMIINIINQNIYIGLSLCAWRLNWCGGLLLYQAQFLGQTPSANGRAG
jgi:hypothetical protein